MSMASLGRAAALVTLSVLVAGSAAAQTYRSEHGELRVTRIANGLEHPWALAFLPDGRLLVTERPGRLRYAAKDGSLGAPLDNVPRVFARGQGGLLDVALDPAFASNRMIYLCFAEPGADGAGTAVARARLGETALDDVQVIFRQVPKTGGGLHFGCRIAPTRAGPVFIALGERNVQPSAQDLGTHLGKVVRIRPDGSVPADNPFAKRAGALPEIWSFGHRNIQGAALHPDSGRLWTVEHGARGGDEINTPEAGKNYGWPVITYGVDYSGFRIGEGTAKAGMEQPVFHWDPSIAPSGLAFYTGAAFPAWRGNLLVGALKERLLARLELDGAKVVKEERLLRELGERIRDVRVGPDGAVYLLTDDANGRILRVTPATP